MADRLARLYGTEEDKVKCVFRRPLGAIFAAQRRARRGAYVQCDDLA